MGNIERVCFTILNSTINNAFKILNNPAIQGWNAGMSVMLILDHLSKLYGGAQVEQYGLLRLKSFFDASWNAQKQPSWAATPTQTGNL
jgi:hypothetical protein